MKYALFYKNINCIALFIIRLVNDKLISTYISMLSPEDLVFYQENGNIMSGGYLIDSILLKEGLSPITTFNQSGGDNSEKVSNIFENLAVPAGLFYKYKKGSPINEYISNNTHKGEQKEVTLSDDIHDQLFKQIEISNKSSKKNLTKRATKKNNKKTKKSKM